MRVLDMIIKELLAVESDNNITFIEGASNWFNRTTLEEWTQDGVYSGSTPSGITITTQHFDKGNENIEMDMTAEINSLISGGTIIMVMVLHSYIT